MLAKKQMNYWVVGVLLMSEFIGPGSTLGTAQGGFETGLSVAWNSSFLAVGFVFYSFFVAPRINALGEYTISGALARHYGPQVKLLVSITMIVALSTVNVSNMTGGGAIIASLFHIDIITAIYCVAAATTLIVAFGGIRGVGGANIIHASCKYAGLLVVAITAWLLVHGTPEYFSRIPAGRWSLVEGAGWPQVLAWLIGNIGAVFSTQYVLQSISALPTPAAARKASLLAAATILPIGFLAAFVGVLARGAFPNIKSVTALPAFFDVMNPWLAALCSSSLIAASLVSILAAQLAVTALVMKDFYAPLMQPNEHHSIWATRVMSVFVGMVPIPFALYVPAMINTYFFARSLRTAISILLLFMLYKPLLASKTGGAVALSVAVIATVIWFVCGNPFGIDNMYVALVIPAPILLADYFLFRRGVPQAKTEQA
ncbi:MAG: sodium:solute symporter family protein [Rhodopila sp.]|nr:sodium:solute symporter family protein [Rhodopila sp.]